MSENKTFVLVDGENITLRYQELLKSGLRPKRHVSHKENLYVWCRDVTNMMMMNIIRVSYYTTAVGDESKIFALEEKIAHLKYVNQGGTSGMGFVNPRVFKKERRSKKNKSVDINITIDALRHTYNNSLTTLYLLSGDGDYIPLIQEVMRQGKRVIVGSFTPGLNPALKHIPDTFIGIDNIFTER